jgi:hypothetical protein
MHETGHEQPADYTFSFEVGLKPAFDIDPKTIKVTRYNVMLPMKWYRKK